MISTSAMSIKIAVELPSVSSLFHEVRVESAAGFRHPSHEPTTLLYRSTFTSQSTACHLTHEARKTNRPTDGKISQSRTL